jgi:hypothetical protein
MQIRILLLIKMIRFCDHGLQTLHGTILNLHASIVSDLGPPWLHDEPQKLLNFSFSVDPDPNPNPPSHPIADPDIASQKDPQFLLKVGFAILFYAHLLLANHLLYVHFSYK